MFVGRKLELAELEGKYASKQFELVALYGRRRIGKTQLLEEFVKEKQTVYFTADQFGPAINLANLSQAIKDLTEPANSVGPFTDFQAAFEAVAELAQASDEPIIFIIDDYPHLAKSSDEIAPSLLQVIEQTYQGLDNLLLVLAGSQVSFMEEQVLGSKSPFNGKVTGQIYLPPLTFTEAHSLLPRIPKEVFMTMYGLTGGVPFYLNRFDDSLSLKENILTFVLHKNTFLYEEPTNLLMQELRTPNRYNDIIAAIAAGATEVREIVSQTGIESGPLTKYMETLIDLEIVEKKTALTDIGKNKPTYGISDGLFRFWYRYVPKYKQFIETNRTEMIWKQIAEDLLQFTSTTFEQYCREWLLEKNGSEGLPFQLSVAGSWWGNPATSKKKPAQSEQVAVIGLGVEDEDLLLGECFWHNEKMDVLTAEQLLQRSKYFPYTNKALFLFSKRGFTKQVKELADEKKIRLISLAEM